MFTTKPTTVDGVLGAFNTAIANLKNVAAVQAEKAAAQEQVIALATAEKEAAQAEAARATDIANKMAAVFN